jgi:hypothetical protein
MFDKEIVFRDMKIGQIYKDNRYICLKVSDKFCVYYEYQNTAGRNGLRMYEEDQTFIFLIEGGNDG